MLMASSTIHGSYCESHIVISLAPLENHAHVPDGLKVAGFSWAEAPPRCHRGSGRARPE